MKPMSAPSDAPDGVGRKVAQVRLAHAHGPVPAGRSLSTATSLTSVRATTLSSVSLSLSSMSLMKAAVPGSCATGGSTSRASIFPVVGWMITSP